MDALKGPRAATRGTDDLIVRKAEPADANALFLFGERLLADTDFLLRSPGERARSVEEMRDVIRRFSHDPRHLLINAWLQNEPVGEAVVLPGGFRRNRHSGTVGVGVLRAYWSRGIGRRLMEAVEAHACAQGLRRLELTVMAHNERALALYRSLGYAVEGRKRHSLLVGGVYVDEIAMARLLAEA